MKYIPQSEIDRVLDSITIEEVIKDYVQLRKEGSRYKACCPVHSERTPSFVVTPKKGIYKCFGCGISGNAITFLTKVQGMAFHEAVEYLANKANISLNITEEDESEEDRETNLKRTISLKICNEAQRFFHSQLNQESSKAKFAKDYLIKRWGERFVLEEGLGYAPGNALLKAWAKEKGFNESLLIELGLLREKDGRVYDGFYDRVIMPIRNRSNNVVGFTARVLDDSKPKYINSPESGIFKKGEIVFGLNVATREAVSQNIFYLVEGAPDVYRLHSLGLTNTVASLGTAWSNEQFNQLKKYADTVCFIPDIDVPGPNELFGPGIKSVIKNGEAALKAGLKVLVKEIVVDGSGKADADSYIKSRLIFDEIEKEDYIIWYTKKLLEGKQSASERAEVLKKVLSLIIKIGDQSYQKILSRQISKIIGISQSVIQSELNSIVKENAINKEERGSKLIDQELYAKYGFYEYKNCYFSLNKDGIEQRWSNFTMRPLFHIKDIINSKRIYEIVNISGRKEIIELKQEDLVSLQRFKVRVESFGNYIWEAKDEQLTKLKGFLYEKTETASEISQLGWQKEHFFAFGNGVYFQKKWIPVDEMGIVRLPKIGNFYLPAFSNIFKGEKKLFQYERRFRHDNFGNISLYDFANKLTGVFGDKGKVGLCFLFASLFKDVITSKTKNFPILNLFGPKGSGKSELGHTLMSFFIINNEPPNLSSATDAALADTVAQCANALVHIDEYKNSIELSRREFIKGLYDGVGRTRMNMDRDKKRETTSVDCGIILSGQEMPTVDIAIFTRMIYLPFNTSEFNSEEKKRFDDLKTIRDLGCSHLVLEILSHRSRVENEFNSNYHTAFNDIQESLSSWNVEDRIFRNWVIILAIFRTLRDVIQLPFEYKDLLNVCVNGIKEQNSICKSSNEIASFWNVVDFLHQNGDIFNESDYRIKYEKEFRGKGTSEKMIFSKSTPVLYLCTKRILMLYRKNGKVVGDNTLPVESLRHYLEVSKEYLGIKNAVRFRNLTNLREATAQAMNADGYATVKQTSRVDWAMCFNYELLKVNYGINLEVQVSDDEDIDPVEIDENDITVPY